MQPNTTTGIRITIENIGPFEQASLEIKPLTIIIGKNSVGKSILAYLTWVLIAATPDFDKLAEITTEHGAAELADEILERIKHGENPESEFKRLIEIYIEALPTAIAPSIKNAIEKTFMTKHWELIHEGTDRATITIEGPKATLEITLDRNDVKATYRKSYTEFTNELTINVPEPKRLAITHNGEIVFSKYVMSTYDMVEALAVTLVNYVMRAFGPFFGIEAALLPDSRAGISRTLLKPYLTPTLAEGVSNVDRQFIGLYYRLAEYMDKGLIDLDLAKPLLEELGLTPEVTLEGGTYTIHARMWTGKRLHIFQTPSGIRESLTVALALASREEPHIVIIEEPEAHLHPRAQRLMARLIAKSINKYGKTIIITTHSDYILYTINNLITLSQNPTKAKELNLEETETINPGKVTAYLIKAQGTKAIIERLEVGPEGIPEEEFAKIAEELAEERAKILT